MKRIVWKAAAALLLAPLALAAQPPSVEGTWQITATFDFEVPCDYTGTGNLTQVGDQVSGQITLSLDSDQPDICPGEMVGSLSATLDGLAFTGTIDGGKNPGGDLGGSTVSGSVVLPAAAGTSAAAAPGTTMSGSSSVSSGPFTSASGTFAGQLAAPAPVMAPVALALLALLLLGGSTLLLVRRRV
ncbi:MAG: hypothetical protein R3325_04120 [Thermoanaerobaculia bacterium]|nr:hypothetical protein [Thermoanaerobaculia bacterium]